METVAEFEAEVNEVTAHLNAQHARLVDAVVEMLANPSWWQDESVPTPHKYLCWRTAISPERAKQIVTIAERAPELPTCMTRFRAGEISVDHMVAIAKRAPWWVDEEIADLAPMLTTHQLRGTLGTYVFPVIPKPGKDDAADEPAPCDADEAAESDTSTEPAPESEAAAERGADVDTEPGSDPAPPATAEPESLWFGWDDEGRFQIHGILAADTGLTLETALKEAADRMFRETGAAVSWPDALRDIAARSLDHVESSDRRDRYRINLHLDTDGTCTDQCGRWLPDAIRQHIGCDGMISPVFYEGGAPISVGRSQHIVPARTRRQVVVRDQGMCRVPGCGNSAFVEIHHIIHWEHEGPTEPWNLICLCPQHHRQHHRGGLRISGNADEPDGVVFTNRHGRPIPASGARPQCPPGSPEPPTGEFRHPFGERLETKWLTFNEPGRRRLKVS